MTTIGCKRTGPRKPMKRTPRKPDEAARKFHAKNQRCALWAYDPTDRCDGKIELHHAGGRSKAFRNDERLHLPLCAWHHRHSKKCSPHGAPAAFKSWLRLQRPEMYRIIYERFSKEIL